jgi:hypothetical protein
MSLESAPVINKGYYDVPICNQYSNVELRQDPPVVINEYQLNKLIQNTVNNNMGRYIVNQDPTNPSPSLYQESDYSQSGYYYNNVDPMSLSFDGRVPPGSKQTSKVYNYIQSDLYPPFGIEKFENDYKNKTLIFILIGLIVIILMILLFRCL